MTRWPTISPRRTAGGSTISGGFAVTAGHGVEEFAAGFRARQDDYSAIMAQALGDRLAEAMAELFHRRARELCGFGRTEDLSYRNDLLRERYRGIRARPRLSGVPRPHGKADPLRIARRRGGDGHYSDLELRHAPGQQRQRLVFQPSRFKVFRRGPRSARTRSRTTPGARAGRWRRRRSGWGRTWTRRTLRGPFHGRPRPPPCLDHAGRAVCAPALPPMVRAGYLVPSLSRRPADSRTTGSWRCLRLDLITAPRPALRQLPTGSSKSRSAACSPSAASPRSAFSSWVSGPSPWPPGSATTGLPERGLVGGGGGFLAAVLMCQTRFEQRPEVLSYALLALQIYGLTSGKLEAGERRDPGWGSWPCKWPGPTSMATLPWARSWSGPSWPRPWRSRSRTGTQRRWAAPFRSDPPGDPRLPLRPAQLGVKSPSWPASSARSHVSPMPEFCRRPRVPVFIWGIPGIQRSTSWAILSRSGRGRDSEPPAVKAFALDAGRLGAWS